MVVIEILPELEGTEFLPPDYESFSEVPLGVVFSWCTVLLLYVNDDDDDDKGNSSRFDSVSLVAFKIAAVMSSVSEYLDSDVVGEVDDDS